MLVETLIILHSIVRKSILLRNIFNNSFYKYLMAITALLAFLARLAIIYFVIKFLWSLFSKGSSFLGSKNKDHKESIKRYSNKGEKIEDADFEEIK